MPTSRQGEARAIASGRAGWKTSVRGNLVLAEVQP